MTRPPDLGFLPQEMPSARSATVADVVDDALAETRADLAELDRLAALLATSEDAAAEYAERLELAQRHEAWDADRRAEIVLAGLGLGAVARERPLGSLSGGERRRLAVAALVLRAHRPPATRRGRRTSGRSPQHSSRCRPCSIHLISSTAAGSTVAREAPCHHRPGPRRLRRHRAHRLRAVPGDTGRQRRRWSAIEIDRGLLALSDDGKAIGTTAAYSFELTLPGDFIVPAAGITAVGVLPTHRRQGVLTEMMRHQLSDLRERGDFRAVLLATEGQIYGRFGYGPATCTRRLTVQRSRALPPARSRC